jgi:hypothetical protein
MSEAERVRRVNVIEELLAKVQRASPHRRDIPSREKTFGEAFLLPSDRSPVR